MKTLLERVRDGEAVGQVMDGPERFYVNPLRGTPCPTIFPESEVTMKVKKVGNVDLPMWCFAFVPDPEQPHTWRLPIHHPSKQRELNLVLAAVERFRDVKIPHTARADVWLRITKQAYKLNVTVPSRMPALKPKPASPQTQQQPNAVQQQKLTAQTLAEKQCQAEADFRAESFLKSIGFWSDEREDN